MKYKAIIFDFDDTLVESRRLKWGHHKFVAKKFYKLDLSDGDIHIHWGKPFSELMSLLYRGLDTVENIYANILSAKEDFHKLLYPGSLELIEELINRNVEIEIVSAAYKQNLIDDFERLGFPYTKFFLIQGSDEVEHHKPDGAVFDKALELLAQKDISKKEILYIGDSLDDYYAADAAGLNFIGLTTGLYTEDDFKNKGAKTVVNSIRGIISVI